MVPNCNGRQVVGTVAAVGRRNHLSPKAKNPYFLGTAEAPILQGGVGDAVNAGLVHCHFDPVAFFQNGVVGIAFAGLETKAEDKAEQQNGKKLVHRPVEAVFYFCVLQK